MGVQRQRGFTGGPGIFSIICMIGDACASLGTLTSVCLPPPGDAGIIRVPDTGRLQRLLPPGCPGLLLFAYRDQRPRTAGVQPPGVGAGDGWPRGTWHRCRQVELGLSGVATDGGLHWPLRL